VKTLAALADQLRVDPADPDEAPTLGLDELPHLDAVTPVRLLTRHAFFRPIGLRLEAKQIDHDNGLVLRTGDQLLNLFRSRVN